MGKKTSFIARMLATAAAVLLLTISATAQSENSKSSATAKEPDAQTESLFFTAERTSDLSIFFKAVKAAGLSDTLKGAGPFTVFAPTDAAFARLPAETLEELFEPQNKERLQALVITHIYATRATASEIPKLNEAVTLKRHKLAIETTDGVRVGGASVTRADIIASNGVMHLIDTVIVPTDHE